MLKKNSFVFLLGTQKNRLNETFLLRIQTCKSLLSACLFLLIKSRISSKIKVIMDNVCLNLPCLCGEQWLNRRVAIFETQRRQSQCFTRCFSTGSTKVDPSRQD